MRKTKGPHAELVEAGGSASLAGRGALYAEADDTLDTSGRPFEESLEALVALTAAG